MSQETLISQSRLSDSPKPIITSWFAARPPSGYEALLCEEESECDEHSEDDEDPQDDSDVELWVLESSSGTGAPCTSAASPSSGERDIESGRKRGHGSRRTRMRGVLQMFIILLTAGLPFTLFFSGLAWLIGGIVLCSIFKVSPYDTTDSRVPFEASMAGAPIVALVVGALAFLNFLVRRLPARSAQAERQYDPQDDAMAVAFASAPASVLAMPLGFLMMPHLATETFGVWHALGWSATGLAVPVGGVLLFFLPQLLWCDAVDL